MSFEEVCFKNFYCRDATWMPRYDREGCLSWDFIVIYKFVVCFAFVEGFIAKVRTECKNLKKKTTAVWALIESSTYLFY